MKRLIAGLVFCLLPVAAAAQTTTPTPYGDAVVYRPDGPVASIGQGLTHVRNVKGPGFVYGAAPELTAPFVALQGGQDQMCDPAATDAYRRIVAGKGGAQ